MLIAFYSMLVFAIILLIAMFYFMYRNDAVMKFRFTIVDMCHAWNLKYQDIKDDESNAYKWFLKKLPAYYQMVFSLKSLKLESWASPEDIKKITGNNNQ